MSYREPDAGAADRERRRQHVFVAFWVVVVLAILIAFRSILVPFILAALIAYVLSPLVRRVEQARVGGRPIPRWVAVLGIYVLMLTGLALTITFATPRIATEARGFAQNEVPRIATEARTSWLPRWEAFHRRYLAPQSDNDADAAPDAAPSPQRHEHGTMRVEPQPDGGYRVVLPPEGVVVERDGDDRYRVVPARGRRAGGAGQGDGAWVARLREMSTGHTGDILRISRGIIGSVIGGVFGFFITLMLSAYMLIREENTLAFATSLVKPSLRPAFHELLARINRGLSGVVRGQLIICAVNGILSAVGFALAGLKYWPLLAIIAAVFSLVPIFGAILSSIPAVAIGLTQGIGTAVFVLAWILGIHQLEANLLNPKIMGDAAKINPVMVVFSLLAGEHFFGILGALLAVPTLSILQSVFLHWRKYALNWGDPGVARDSLSPAEARVAVPSAAGEGGEGGRGA